MSNITRKRGPLTFTARTDAEAQRLATLRTAAEFGEGWTVKAKVTRRQGTQRSVIVTGTKPL
jgi:hypothetical protein